MSRIFFNKITVVDHSKITPDGFSSGGSYNLNFTAELDSCSMDEEQVVVDFSSGKKEVKEIVDRHCFNPEVNGWDHKTWFAEGPSVKAFGDANRGGVETPHLKVEGPWDAFRKTTNGAFESNTLLQKEFEKYIDTILNQKREHPVKYKVYLDEDPYPNIMGTVPNIKTRKFRYQHGLRHSTSYGCQNILHGHLSFVRVGHNNKHKAIVIADMIAERLQGSYIYHRDTRIGSEQKFAYTTKRGDFSLEFFTPIKLIELPYEPTIENIFDETYHWLQTNYSELAKGIRFLEISEGLQKGATL